MGGRGSSSGVSAKGGSGNIKFNQERKGVWTFETAKGSGAITRREKRGTYGISIGNDDTVIMHSLKDAKEYARDRLKSGRAYKDPNRNIYTR